MKMDFPKTGIGSGMRPGTPATSNTQAPAAIQTNKNQPPELPKCFGTDYFGKWNMTGMTFESMKIDNTEYQRRCAFCPFFDRCYFCNHIRLLRIKR